MKGASSVPQRTARRGSKSPLTATVCGSFKRHLGEVTQAVGELTSRGVRVLSPSSPEVVDRIGEFPFVASDRSRSVRMVEDRHLEAVENSDFVWLVCPDGNVGLSAAFEIGCATRSGVPVLSTSKPRDATLREYVIQVDTLRGGIEGAKKFRSQRTRDKTLLLNPDEALAELEQRVQQIQHILDAPPNAIRDGAAQQFDAQREAIKGILGRIPVRRLP